MVLSIALGSQLCLGHLPSPSSCPLLATARPTSTLVELVVPTGQGPSDASLVERAVAGDRAALGTLYDRHAERTLLRVTRLLGRSAEAEDVTQDAFLTAFGDLGALRDPERFGAWLLQIAVRQVHRRFRKRRLLERLGMASGESDASLQALANGVDAETQLQLARVDAVLGGLATELRIAWMLRAVEGCSLGEVADQTGCSLATAKRRIAAAQAAVRKAVAVELPEDES